MTPDQKILWVMFLSSAIGTCLTHIIIGWCAIRPLMQRCEQLNKEKIELIHLSFKKPTEEECGQLVSDLRVIGMQEVTPAGQFRARVEWVQRWYPLVEGERDE